MSMTVATIALNDAQTSVHVWDEMWEAVKYANAFIIAVFNKYPKADFQLKQI